MKKIALILVISFLMTFAALPYGLLADSGTALTISYVYPDVGFNIYRVAEEVNGKYQFTKDFEGCDADLDVKYNSERGALISALSAHVKINEIAPTAAGRTVGTGKLTFDGLMNGIYLILGERSEDSSQYHFPAESLATLTGDLTVEIKHDDIDKPVIPPFFTFVTVTKTWDVPEGTEIPNSVTVNLLRDGEMYDTIELDESNNWTYIWSKLAPGHDWSITEADVPDGYTSSIERIGTTFRITNTMTTDTSTDDTKHTETTGPSDDMSRPDTDETSPDMKPDDQKPPKTGDNITLPVLIFVLSAALTATMAVITYRRVKAQR